MKKLIFTALLFIFLPISMSGKVIVFSKWECSYSESVYRDGRVEYSAYYKGKTYILTTDQYYDLIEGKDIVIKTEE